MIRLNQIGYLYLNTWQKELRNKTLLFLTAFTIFVIVASYYIVTNIFAGLQIETGPEMSIFAPQKIFLSVLGIWTSLMAIILATGLVKGDEEENVLHQILALPITRGEYLLARILGGLSILMALYLFSGLLIMLLFGFNDQSFVDFVPLMSSLYSTLMMVLCIILVTLLFSFYLPKIFSFISAFFSLIIIANANSSFIYSENFFKTLSTEGLWIKIMGVVHLLFPPSGSWASLNQNILSNEATMSNLAWGSLHSLVSCSLFFLILNWLFKRREL